MGERARDGQRLLERQRSEHPGAERLERLGVAGPSGLREAPHPLDRLEHGPTLAFADHVAEQRAEQAHVGPKGGVGVGGHMYILEQG